MPDAVLTRRLATLCDKAERHPGVKQSLELQRGLSVHAYITSDKHWHVMLQRFDIAPSATEFEVVLKHWPRPLPATRPVATEKNDGRRHAMTAQWKAPGVKDYTVTQSVMG
jgi:hypothetical protein